MKDVSATIRFVILVAPSNKGHHPMYLTFAIKALSERGFRVCCLSPKVNDVNFSRAIARHAVVCKEIPRMSANHGLLKNRRIVLEWLGEIKRCISELKSERACEVNRVLFMWADSILAHYILKSEFTKYVPYECAGLLFHSDCINRNKRSLLWRLFSDICGVVHSSNWRALAIGDQSIVSSIARQYKHINIIPLPEVTELDESVTSNLVDMVFKKAKGRCALVMAGAVSRRKGLVAFMNMIECWPKDRYFFIIAGQRSLGDMEKDESSRFKKLCLYPPENVWISPDEFLDASVLNSLITNASGLFAFYQGFDSTSNMLAKAARLQVPLIASHSRELKHNIEKYNMGVCFKAEIDLLRCADTLDQMLYEKRNAAAFKLGCESYKSINSSFAFESAIEAILV